MGDLVLPPEGDVLYRYLRTDADPVPVARPIMQGDVFELDMLPGVFETTGEAAVLSHPCTMRGRDGQLGPYLLMASVDRKMSTSLARYRNNYYSMFPLRGLVGGLDCEILLDDIGRVTSGSLDVTRRVCCLSDFGLSALQQRQVHALTRHVVECEVLHHVNSPALLEAELLEDWTEAGTGSGLSVAECSAEFAHVFSQFREGAQEYAKHSGIRQAVRYELAKRFSS